MKDSRKPYVYLGIYSVIVATAITYCEEYFAGNFLASVLIPTGVATAVGGGYSLVQKVRARKKNDRNDLNTNDTHIESKDDLEQSIDKKKDSKDVQHCERSLVSDNNLTSEKDKPKVLVKKR